MKEKIGLFTGTFDPLTNGHLDIIKRASQHFDKLYVGIFKNDQKNPLFPTELRVKMLKEALAEVRLDLPLQRLSESRHSSTEGAKMTEVKNVEVITHERDLTVNIAKKLGVTALVRSVRNAQDLEYEKNMYYFNHQMTGVETILFMADPALEPINSTRMRELHAFGQDISPWIPKNVAKELRKLDEQSNQ